ncbi:uncharacterized protein LOC113493552 isoform X3 [Trichoplusia ni]|uniref:Uncharacterized protein LOC113493552 isoform X3 n=1 Tax=Trichoplusia ni TaxID=7111 RepID=A0A7E5VGK1_TRINI|nr:uncharacterized protein LOC113493552 isoform X3 [Trichoplusia ni]
MRRPTRREALSRLSSISSHCSTDSATTTLLSTSRRCEMCSPSTLMSGSIHSRILRRASMHRFSVVYHEDKVTPGCPELTNKLVQVISTSKVNMSDEIDIEEHDLMDNPTIKQIFPDLSVIKQELNEYFFEAE